MISKFCKQTIISLGFGSVCIYGLYYIYKCVFKKEWKYVGYLSEINFYPVKSCAGIKLEEVECDILGFRKEHFSDRCFMITDIEGLYQSGRSLHKLVNIKPQMNQNCLILHAENIPPLTIDIKQLNSSLNIMQCNIWHDVINVIYCGDEAAEWISKVILNKSCGLKLVYYPYNKINRTLRSKFTVSPNMTANDIGLFTDGTSYLLTTNSSLDDLNARLQYELIDMNQFRPNLVVKGGKAYDEDNWTSVQIGNKAIFEVLLPCVRCDFINVNPLTGFLNENGEPLQTLKTYRQVTNISLRKIIGDAPVMGIHIGLREKGQIKIGDPVYVKY